ncbi:MAG: hypothetical protein AAGE52_16145 [Myxococcota bacterium]
MRWWAVWVCCGLFACEGSDPGVDVGVFDGGVDASNVDAAVDAGFDAGDPDAGDPDAGPRPDGGPLPHEPEDIFFVGNSFTFGGPIPELVHDLAVFAGHVEPNVEYRALPGVTLQAHRDDARLAGAPTRVAEGWDVVVLQENSLRPTDALGNPERFKEDATWFHDLALESRPGSRVILYETWARRAGHSVYDSSFESPTEMQAQLRFHYFDAADRYIPMFSMFEPAVEVAPAGDAWEFQLMMGEPPQLHASDDWHAGPAGQYLNALVIYSTIYGRSASGLAPLGVDAFTAGLLQDAADAVTGADMPIPILEDPDPLPEGAILRSDLGPDTVDGWPAITSVNGSVGPVSTVMGERTRVTFRASGFLGGQTGGNPANDLGWPGDVSADTLWLGSFDGHADALGRTASTTLANVPPGEYTLELFASRDGDDVGRGRLTRYTIDGTTIDLEVADNTDRVARFDGVRPDDFGEIRIVVEVSPEGTSRFAYLGAIVVTRTGE